MSEITKSIYINFYAKQMLSELTNSFMTALTFDDDISMQMSSKASALAPSSFSSSLAASSNKLALIGRRQSGQVAGGGAESMC